MKILVTGGAGYIGAEIAKKLSNSEMVSQVVIYDNFEKGLNGLLRRDFNQNKVKIVKADILDSRSLGKEVTGSNLIIHAAGIGNPYASNNFQIHHLEQVNHWGTAEVVLSMETFSPNAQLVYLSSTEVAHTENHSAFASSIARAEEEVERLVMSGRATILRLSDVFGYGSNLRTDTLFNKMITDGAFFGKVRILGDGNQQFTFSWLDDIVNATECATKKKLPAGVFNIVSHSATLNTVADEISKNIGELDTIYAAHHFKLSGSNAIHTLPIPQSTLTLSEATAQFSIRILGTDK